MRSRMGVESCVRRSSAHVGLSTLTYFCACLPEVFAFERSKLCERSLCVTTLAGGSELLVSESCSAVPSRLSQECARIQSPATQVSFLTTASSSRKLVNSVPASSKAKSGR